MKCFSSYTSHIYTVPIGAEWLYLALACAVELYLESGYYREVVGVNLEAAIDPALLDTFPDLCSVCGSEIRFRFDQPACSLAASVQTWHSWQDH